MFGTGLFPGPPLLGPGVGKRDPMALVEKFHFQLVPKGPLRCRRRPGAPGSLWQGGLAGRGARTVRSGLCR